MFDALPDSLIQQLVPIAIGWILSVLLMHSVFFRMWPLPHGMKWLGYMLSGIAIGLPLTAYLVPALSRHQGTLSALISWAGFGLMGFVATLGLMLFIRILAPLPWILRRRRIMTAKTGTQDQVTTEALPDGSEALTRRQFLVWATPSKLTLAAIGLTCAGMVECRDLVVRHVKVPVANLSAEFAGFRIAQITDLHAGYTIDHAFVARIARMVSDLDVDAVAITGDLVAGHPWDSERLIGPLAHLRSRHGTFVCTGNHEYYWDAEAWVARWRKMGLIPLINESRVLTRHGAHLSLTGICDPGACDATPSHIPDLTRMVAGLPGGSSRVLLAHRPLTINDTRGLGFGLQLSGHIHGGQFQPMAALVSLFQPYINGLYQVRKTSLYVSPGVGYWLPPDRLGVRPQIECLELVATRPT